MRKTKKNSQESPNKKGRKEKRMRKFRGLWPSKKGTRLFPRSPWPKKSSGESPNKNGRKVKRRRNFRCLPYPDLKIRSDGRSDGRSDARTVGRTVGRSVGRTVGRSDGGVISNT